MYYGYKKFGVSKIFLKTHLTGSVHTNKGQVGK